jgi:DNA repair protein RecO (recombination protein O)
LRGQAARRVDTEALVVRTVEYGEADVIATLFTRVEGKVSAIVRGARKGSRRLGGALEPMHTMTATYEDRGGELVTVKEARITRVRAALATRLDALESAGQALRWLRHVCPPRTPEPGAWAAAIRLLDTLDTLEPDDAAEPALAAFGLELVAEVGWAIDFERCVRCGKACPAERPALLDAARGGLVCQACGGARRLVAAPVRALALAIGGPRGGWPGSDRAHGARPVGRPEEWRELLSILADVMAAHTGFEA